MRDLILAFLILALLCCFIVWLTRDVKSRRLRVALVTLVLLVATISISFHQWRQTYDNPPSPTFYVTNRIE
jgi:peptidoglycan/LPS O-acetylase OafA/YrhL